MRELPCPSCATRCRVPDAGGASSTWPAPACGETFPAMIGARCVGRPRLERRWLGLRYEAVFADAEGRSARVELPAPPRSSPCSEGELFSIVFHPRRARPDVRDRPRRRRSTWAGASASGGHAPLIVNRTLSTVPHARGGDHVGPPGAAGGARAPPAARSATAPPRTAARTTASARAFEAGRTEKLTRPALARETRTHRPAAGADRRRCRRAPADGTPPGAGRRRDRQGPRRRRRRVADRVDRHPPARRAPPRVICTGWRAAVPGSVAHRDAVHHHPVLHRRPSPRRPAADQRQASPTGPAPGRRPTAPTAAARPARRAVHHQRPRRRVPRALPDRVHGPMTVHRWTPSGERPGHARRGRAGGGRWPRRSRRAVRRVAGQAALGVARRRPAEHRASARSSTRPSAGARSENGSGRRRVRGHAVAGHAPGRRAGQRGGRGGRAATGRRPRRRPW